MSLILEALRKSEAERRRGAAPDLRAELPPTPDRLQRGVPLRAALALAACVAVLIVAGLWWRAAKPPGQRVVVTSGAEPILGSDPASPSSSEPSARSADLTTPESAGNFPPVPRIQAPASMQPAPEVAPDPPGAAAAAARAAARPAIAIAPLQPPAAVATSRPNATAEPAPSAVEPKASDDATSANGDIPTIAALPPAERSQLPAMKLTMHMWNAQAARRFVIIDGERHVEGDRIGAAVITRIDTTGVILDLNGRAVRVPLY